MNSHFIHYPILTMTNSLAISFPLHPTHFPTSALFWRKLMYSNPTLIRPKDSTWGYQILTCKGEVPFLSVHLGSPLPVCSLQGTLMDGNEHIYRALLWVNWVKCLFLDFKGGFCQDESRPESGCPCVLSRHQDVTAKKETGNGLFPLKSSLHPPQGACSETKKQLPAVTLAQWLSHFLTQGTRCFTAFDSPAWRHFLNLKAAAEP